MAEYYPLLAKAIGSLPNSTPESRRVVYERARKALIGQLRTLHPPVADEDIDRESVELDRAVERLESELANGITPPPPPAAPAAPPQVPAPPTAKAANPKPSNLKPSPPKSPGASPPKQPKPPAAENGVIEPAAAPPSPPAQRPKPPALPERKPLAPRPPIAKPILSKPVVRETPALPPAETPVASNETPVAPQEAADAAAIDRSAPPARYVDAEAAPHRAEAMPIVDAPTDQSRAEPPGPETGGGSRPLKPPRRPIAPQPPGAKTSKRALWIIPTVVAVVVAIVAVAAWKLRDRPEKLARKPAEQSPADSGKIAERVGAPATAPSGPAGQPAGETKPGTEPSPAANQAPANAPANPELPVARRAALLVEAPDEPNKVKTFVGNVVWKLNNAPQGANAAVGLAVEADIDLPDDKLKATVIFEKNSEASLPASHTIKIRFSAEPGSFSGNVKQISVPQMRPEASPNGEPLAGVTVQIVPNSFLVGLSPGNAEAANTDLMRRLQWVDIPMLLDNGKIAKLTFEKGESGQRDLNEAFESWQK